MAKKLTIEELLAGGSDAEKQHRIRDLEPEARSAIEHAIASGNSQLAVDALQMMLDTALLVHSLSDSRLRRKYNEVWKAFEALTAFDRVRETMPNLVKDNQEKAFRFLLALGMLLPSDFAYSAAWHIVAEQDVVRDPHQIAAIGNRHLRFFAEAVEPFLFKEMFDARDRGDQKTFENMSILWETNMQHMFLIHRSTATYIVKRRLRVEAEKANPDVQKQTMLERMNVAFNSIDKLERERRLRLAQEQGSDPTKLMFGEAAREVSATVRPEQNTQIISGTPASQELKRPGQAMKMLTKFKPPEGSKPN